MKFSLISCGHQFFSYDPLVHHRRRADEQKNHKSYKDELMPEHPIQPFPIPFDKAIQLRFKPQQEPVEKIGRLQIVRFSDTEIGRASCRERRESSRSEADAREAW